MIMINVDLQQLIRTLTPPVRRDLERSSERCVTRGGREVLVEDLLLALLEQHLRGNMLPDISPLTPRRAGSGTHH